MQENCSDMCCRRKGQIEGLFTKMNVRRMNRDDITLLAAATS